MRAVVQRVREASVSVDGVSVASIGAGLLVLCGIAPADSDSDIEWLTRKIVSLRVFDDADGVMNRSVAEAGGGILAVSQFTLYASTRKGARPSYSAAAPPDKARALFDAFVRALKHQLGASVPTGVFGAHMHVALVNDGPVTLWLDTAARE
jgi:D-tyrosyl-tRNA(Tyr) deacylase